MLFRGQDTSPHFSRPVRNAHGVPTFVRVSRESFRPGKPHPKGLATGGLPTNRRICEKVRLESLNKRKALLIAQEYEKAAKQKRTVRQVQKTLDRLHELITGARWFCLRS